MLPKINPIQTSAWKKLTAHYAEMKPVRMKTLFDKDPKRFEKMSIQFNELLFDYSKNIWTDDTKSPCWNSLLNVNWNLRLNPCSTLKR